MNKTILITGGSRGIGAATALLAAAKDYSVCISYQSNHTAAAEVVDRIRAEGGQAWAYQADVADEKDVLALFQAIDREVGPLTALVNNAGILEQQCRVEDLDTARLQRILLTNVVGTILCAREAVRRMSTQRGGKGGAIVNVSSIAARTGSPGEYVDYAASKGAVDSFTRGLGGR